MIDYIDRKTGQVEQEQVFGAKAIQYLYSNGILPYSLRELVCRNAFFSALYGFWQKRSWTKKTILPFIKKYGVDPTEFLNSIESFTSFNDFFTRKLKPFCRPITQDKGVAVMPADGRYFAYSSLSQAEQFYVKGKPFCLKSFLQNDALAGQYHEGSALFVRLCPSDYHRFHFPCDGIAKKAEPISGALYSVNPLALRKNPRIFSENKRVLTLIDSPDFGQIAYVEVGATCVGSIVQTYTADQFVKRGQEKGFFQFGGSTLVLLFLPGSIRFSDDLLAATKRGLELRCLLGEPLGISQL